MEISIKSFNELTIDELYAVLRLRSEVFVVEQDCVYQDIDMKDQKALHVLGMENGDLLAYTRIFDRGYYFERPSIGRVVVDQGARGKAFGHEIIKASIQAINDHFGPQSIEISAQTYLDEFYKAHGFQPVGEPYLEDGIPHIRMIRS